MMGLVKRILKGLLVGIAVLIAVYLLGPQVDRPDLGKTLPEVPTDLVALEAGITAKENATPNIRPDNHARIIWADSLPTKTPYSIVYLHGWSASQEEGDPLHQETARRYGCNLYLPRLAGHGLQEEDPMADLTADKVIASAKEAIAVAKQLGDKVIIMATSTGGTLALHLAGGDPDIAALLLYSPNVAIFDTTAPFLAKPWGLQIAKWVTGSDYHEFDTDIDLKNQYWTTRYRLKALTHLQAMIDGTMQSETFEAVKQPVFMGYFYKNDSIQDNVVSVPAMLAMFDDLGTPTELKEKVAFPEAGDHVMTSYITSKDLEGVTKSTHEFMDKVLKMKPVPLSVAPLLE